MSQYVFETRTEEETKQLANKLAVLLQPNDVLTLEGDLGAGKTTFTKGLGAGLGVRRTINSPTFTIVKEYMGEMPLYHMDVYRLENSEEDIGFDEYFRGEGVTVVEWAHFIEAYLPKERLEIQIKRVDDETRKLIFTPLGDHFESVCKELQE
ncbi:tRNA (adenosine(37)-N6)-threonylcarbamoyltransferase complex ATPase subunit type 1 TsaE [Gracilibacillus sp. S3-1-1]|uniref:tRNA (Adenosine(37)-N6)-threonylcarbamoyltransferase complex ATPase subunit type 1 TsaE n=1 Tax=Gracilibacillus pellucidus TaxID=3095368 RepID=A0ACC6M9F7_9BACI|nr:tRNA (adenosine(37)-N6)-threonylcarbamoyltransferase complex ATPase subunit type 1 TsaE [Gracilibacillus sp. S3-1-1]MDX8047579.1 tRNA (adenosine(37)-N6)-threonylcarbamoyltransferase complex ATPase subunit type 1 TsaE [Gracilibacillus sp. S3-1-1]